MNSKAAISFDETISEGHLNPSHDTVGPADLALDLDATARLPVKRRIFWDGDVLVRLGKTTTDLSKFLKNFTPEARTGFKSALLVFIDSKIAGDATVIEFALILRNISKEFSPSILDTKWVSFALESMTFRRKKALFFKILDFINDRQPGIVTNDALSLLVQAEYAVQLSSNVRSDDPKKSWLTDYEHDSVIQYCWNKYDLTNNTSSALVRLLSIQYARRPTQLAALKFCDLKSGDQKEIPELSENEIHFPAAKERDAASDFRTGKVEPHPIAKHLWDLLTIQRQEIKSVFEEALGIKLTESQTNKLPIFTNRKRVLAGAAVLRNELDLNPSQSLGDELFHFTAHYIAKIISLCHDITEVGNSRRLLKHERISLGFPISERTNEPLIITATRLRHTQARRLARQGVHKTILSHWLGHNDDTAIDAYYDDPAEDARRYDGLIGKGLAPIAQAFHGKIIATDADATHPTDPLKRLEFGANGRLGYVGRCGSFSFCATTSIPIPCYRCQHFEPLEDAPHEEVRDALIYRQGQENAAVKPGSLRNLLVPIDLSADIRAVERCIELCKIKRKSK